MKRVVDKYRRALDIGDWVYLIGRDYNGDYIYTKVTKIVQLDEYYIKLQDGTHIGGGDRLGRITCLELIRNRDEIMMAILENA